MMTVKLKIPFITLKSCDTEIINDKITLSRSLLSYYDTFLFTRFYFSFKTARRYV